MAYNSTINGGANAQVLFREKITLNLSGSNSLAGVTLSKVYGDASTLNSSTTALLGDMRSQLKQNNLGNINTTVNGIAVTVSKAAVIDDLTGTLQNAQYSTSGYLQANTYSYGALSGSKYTTSLTAGQAQVAVSKLALTGSISRGETTYGDTLTAGMITFTNKVGADLLTPTIGIDTVGRLSTGGYLKAGNYTAIESITALSGNDAGNYTFANVKGDYKVNALALTGVTIASASTVYGSTLMAGSISFSGSNLKSGDIVGATASVVNTTSDLSASNALKVGTYSQTVTQINSGNANNDGSNYTFVPVTASSSYTVTQKELTLTPSSVAKEYDGTSSLVGVSLTPTGVIGIDTVNAVAGSGSFNDINAASSVSFTLGGLSLTGGDAANYKLPVSVIQNGLSGTGTILGKVLTIVGGTAEDKTFDGNTSVRYTPGVLNGLVLGETLSLSSSAVFADANIGANKDVLVTYNIANGSGSASNYQFANSGSTTRFDAVLRASIVAAKPQEGAMRPFVNPTSPTTKPVQSIDIGSPSRVNVMGANAVTVKAEVARPQNEMIASNLCVPTLLTGANLCFLASE